MDKPLKFRDLHPAPNRIARGLSWVWTAGPHHLKPTLRIRDTGLNATWWLFVSRGVVAACFLVLLPRLAPAATLNVPAQYASIQQAANAAQPGDVVAIAPGTYTARVTTVRPGVTFRATGTGAAIVSAQRSGSVFTIDHDSTRLEGLHIRLSGSAAGSAGVRVRAGQGVELVKLDIESCRTGVLLEGSASVSVDRSRVWDCTAAAVSATGTLGLQVRNCFIHDTDAGVAVSGTTQLTLTNNTLSDIDGDAVRIGTGATGTLQNNAITFSDTGIRVASGGAAILRHNALHNLGTAYVGVASGSTDLAAAPNYLNRNGRDYHLAPGSPLRDAGRSAGSPNVDFDGDSRPQGDGVDIGADEIPGGPAYADALLDGSYAVHDLFAPLDGGGLTRTGTRVFDGTGQVLVLEAGRTPYQQTYSLAADGRLGYDGGDLYGSAGLAGHLVLHVIRIAAGQDPSIPAGYGALRIAALPEAGATDARFVGDYSFHSLTGDDSGGWRSAFGLAAASGQGVFLRAPEGGSATLHTYRVRSSGAIAFDSGPENRGTLLAGGAFIVETVVAAKDENPSQPKPHTGLRLYLRRSIAAGPADFTGTYRMHELRPDGDGVQGVTVGTIQSGGLGTYAGTVTRNGVDSGVSGTLTINPTGTIRVGDRTFEEGTLGAGGEVLVFSKHLGMVTPGVGGDSWLQIWVRTAGGGPTSQDRDGDGLSDADEALLGTNPDDPDTDNDGLPDGVDPEPLKANDLLTVSPKTLTFRAEPGGPVTAAQMVNIAIENNPFFRWTATPSASWIALDRSSGVGSASLQLRANPTAFEDAGTVSGEIVVAAPGMRNSPQRITLTLLLGSQEGDVNGDGTVDAADLQLTVNIVLGAAPHRPEADLNQDGAVDAVDIQHLVNRLLGIS